jgi:pimeloyl-ACP methyl ester carboxylesterase
VLNYLPKSYHVYAISQRGFGNSDRPGKGYFPKDFADDLAAFIKSQKLPPAIVIGHSFGATVTQQFALSYPELIRGIVLEGAMVSFDDKKDLVDYKEIINTLQDPVDTAMIREFQQSTLANAIDEAFFDTLLMESLKVKAHVWKEVWEGLMKAANYRSRIAQVNKPALIIWGEKDNFGPRADQDLFVASIKGAKLIVYEGTGHSLHWEEPMRFAKDITTFIEAIR